MGDQRVIAKEYEVSSSGNKKSSLIDWGDAAQLCEYTTNHWLVYYKQLNYISLKLFPKISIPLLNIKNAELLHNSSFETRVSTCSFIQEDILSNLCAPCGTWAERGLQRWIQCSTWGLWSAETWGAPVLFQPAKILSQAGALHIVTQGRQKQRWPTDTGHLLGARNRAKHFPCIASLSPHSNPRC